MNWKRIWRAALCLLVVCCLIFNYVSVPTKALALADDIALGIFALLVLASAGMVVVPQSQVQIGDIGSAFKTSMYQWGTSAEKLDEVEDFVSAFSLYDPSGGDDDDGDTPNELKIKLARGILAGIAAWIASTIMAGRVETEGETAPDGYVYYGDCLVPSLSTLLPAVDLSDFPYLCLFYSSYHEQMVGFVTQQPLLYDPIEKELYYNYVEGLSYGAYDLCIVDGQWRHLYDADVDYPSGVVYVEQVYYMGTWSDASTEYVPAIDPAAWFGDLPQKIQNGEADADDIVVPPEINYDILTQNGMPLAQSVVNTMNELATGKIEYDEYLDYIAPVPVPDPEPEPEPEPEPDPEPVVDPLANTSLQRFLDSLVNALMDPLRWLANALLDGIRAMFVPSEDFITDKVNALRDKFAFADSIIETGQAIGTALSVGDSGPPVIYMHLQDAESDINWGGTVPALDMRWYERYKPTVDSLLSAMLWIFFAWRVFRKLPGIISGMEGDAPFEPVSDGRLGHYVSNLPRIGVTSMRRRD